MCFRNMDIWRELKHLEDVLVVMFLKHNWAPYLKAGNAESSFFFFPFLGTKGKKLFSNLGFKLALNHGYWLIVIIVSDSSICSAENCYPSLVGIIVEAKFSLTQIYWHSSLCFLCKSPINFCADASLLCLLRCIDCPYLVFF